MSLVFAWRLLLVIAEPRFPPWLCFFFWSAKTNSNSHSKAKDNNVTSTSRLPRQGSDESLVQSSTVKQSQTQSIKKEVDPIHSAWVAEYEAAEALESDFSRISERLNNDDDS